MRKQQKEAILLSFLGEKEKYKKLAEFMVHLIQDDPLLPKESLHTIIYRIKDELRLIEKIDRVNKEIENGVSSITEKNYQTRIGDLLGVRRICLRLSDFEKIEAYLKLMSEENILYFAKKPVRKRSFILPVDTGEYILDDAGIRYTGYSSMHYQIKLGKNSDAPSELKNLHFELQLRTILEEAWSEIDHKYRYVRSRIGLKLPEHIHTGFYNLSAYLQVAAFQAEYLCRLAEAYSLKKITKVKRKAAVSHADELPSIDKEKDEAYRKLSVSEIETYLKKILGFKVANRTLVYIEKRLADINTDKKVHKTLQKLLTKNSIEFMRKNTTS